MSSLRREVEPPSPQPSGLGIMLVAALSMFFAVAGSAFIVRAKLASHDCQRRHYRPAPVRVIQTAPPITLEVDAVRCGEPVFRALPDGRVSVGYHVCH